MKTFKTIIILLSFMLPISTFAQNIQLKRLDGSRISTSEVDQTVTRLMREAHVTGLSLAILNDNKIAYVKSFGLRNKEAHLPLTENSVMYGASFTKSVFAYFVMQLVSEGMIDLDKPVQQYLPKPLPEYEKYKDLAADERYKLITMRMLLSHTTGFPNFRFINPDGKLNINFTPGTRYAYSGEGINLAQFVVETVTKKDVGEMMRDRIFKPFGMTTTSMTWDEKFKADLAIGYDEKEKVVGHNMRKSVRAAGSMDTTISDFARFLEAVMQGKAQTKKAKNEMLKPQIQIYSAAQFPSLNTVTTNENRKIKLAYGIGVGLFETPYGKAFFKEGHDDGWENHFVVFPDKKIGIAFMSNSSNGDSIFKELLEILIKDKYTPWKWEGYLPFLNGQTSFPGTLSQSEANKNGVLRGTIVEPADARVTMAKIILKNNNNIQQVTSDMNGEFRIALPEGTYQIIVEADGFKKYQRKKITIESGKTETLQIKLRINPLGVGD